MAINVTTETVTDTPEPFDFGDSFNGIDATVFVTGDESIFIGGPDVDDDEHGIEWLPGSEHTVALRTNNKLYRRTAAGLTSTVKILNTGN